MFIDFRERKGGEEGEGERQTLTWERNIDHLLPVSTPTRDRTRPLGMCPDQGTNLQPSGVWDNAPIIWATRPGHFPYFLKIKTFSYIAKSHCIGKNLNFLVSSYMQSISTFPQLSPNVPYCWFIQTIISAGSSTTPGDHCFWVSSKASTAPCRDLNVLKSWAPSPWTFHFVDLLGSSPWGHLACFSVFPIRTYV